MKLQYASDLHLENADDTQEKSAAQVARGII
jgi:hypothetical protein